MLDGVYVDAKEDKRIVAIKPKPPFRPVFQVATTREGSGVEIMKSRCCVGTCLWWRRGRVELGREHEMSLLYVGLWPESVNKPNRQPALACVC